MQGFEAFGKQVEEVLQHLYDYAYLERHPLAERYAEHLPGQASRAQRLRRLVLEAIEELSPPPSTPPTFPEWRPYRVLTLRYIEGASLQDMMGELAISERQFYRVQRHAVSGLTELLWEKLARFTQASAAETEPSPAKVALSVGGQTEVGDHGLRDEVVRLTATTEAFSLGDLVDGVIEAVGPLAEERRVAVRLMCDENVRSVCTNRTVCRQLLILLLDALLSKVDVDSMVIELAAEGASVGVTVSAGLKEGARGGHVPAADLSTVQYLVESIEGVWRGQEAADEAYRVRFDLPTDLPRVILSIEDNPSVTRLIERYVTGHGYRVVGTHSGPEALALIGDLQPDVILLDIMMPGQDGWEILQQVRERAGHLSTPILICSVLDQHDLAQTLGASGYLKKPFTQHQLLAALASVQRET